MTGRIRVGIIFGGRSGEHEVSLRSARSIMGAIDRDKYEVVPMGITKEGRWLIGGDPMKTLLLGADPRMLTALANLAAMFTTLWASGLMTLLIDSPSFPWAAISSSSYTWAGRREASRPACAN